MSSAELQCLTSTVLRDLFASGKVTAPITSMDLLTAVISSRTSCEPSSSASPRFRLTDLKCFELILESLSQGWEHGYILTSREGSEAGLCVLEVHLGTAADWSGLDLSNSKKRKRVVDEDADSASGKEQEDENTSRDNDRNSALTPLEGLSKELREVYAILQKGTAKGRLLAEQYKSQVDGFEPICPHITKEDCVKFLRQSTSNPDIGPCSRIHFRPLIRTHTDPTLGHCSYLNTCYSEPTYAHSPSIPPFPGSGPVYPNVNQRGAVSLPSGLGAGGRGKEKAPCRYLHFEVDWDGDEAAATSASGEGGVNGFVGAAGMGVGKLKDKEIIKPRKPYRLGIGLGPDGVNMKVLPPQWINCDVRRFDYSILGKFHVIMADPPWDIHMSLPYGTMTDDEMRAMPIPLLQDEGFLFLWVTGRAMEVGRECLRVWGYTRVDEVVWVKTNQLQRVIRTGRTGHWLNHTKEHMLVGVKTVIDPDTGMLKFPSWANRGMDTDVIVSEVRETSRKPDEAYGMIERMCPGGRKIEIFGRKHNTRPGWLTLGNQLGADQIFEADLAARIRDRYPDRNAVQPTSGDN